MVVSQESGEEEVDKIGKQPKMNEAATKDITQQVQEEAGVKPKNWRNCANEGDTPEEKKKEGKLN